MAHHLVQNIISFARGTVILPLALSLAGCGGAAWQRTPAPSGSSVSVSRPAEGTLQVRFLDVGQGDAALVQAPGGTSVLIDGGPPGAGPAVLEDLRAAGVRKLDWVIGSHPHADHIGGLIDVLRELPAEQALDPGYNHGTATQKTYLGLLRSGKVKTTRARAGQSYDLGGGARLEILAPEEPLIKGTESDPNNNSIVARLVFGETKFLFTGDMEEEQRKRLLQSVSPEELRADVLKVSHHGSHNGTDAEFLRAVRPEYAVLSLGKGNDYGHPHREAVQALRHSGAKLLRTDERGDILFTSDGRTLTLHGPQPAAGAAQPPSAREGRVIGNRSSKVYHAPDCPALPAEERRVPLRSAAAAEKEGYRPHQACTR